MSEAKLKSKEMKQESETQIERKIKQEVVEHETQIAEVDQKKEEESTLAVTQTALQGEGLKEDVESFRGEKKLDEELERSTNSEEIKSDFESLGVMFENSNTEDIALGCLQFPEKQCSEIDKTMFESFNIYVGRNVIGSLMSKILHNSKSTLSSKINTEFLNDFLNKNDFSSPENLEKVLSENNVDLSPKEKSVLVFLNGDSVFAKQYKKEVFPNIAQSMKDSMPEFVKDYNEQYVETEGGLLSTVSSMLGYTYEGASGVLQSDSWKNNTMKTAVGAAAITGGLYVGYKAISGIFSWFGSSEEENKDAKSKEKSKSGVFDKIMTALKYGAPLALGGFLVKKLLEGKGFGDMYSDLEKEIKTWFIDDKKSGTGTDVGIASGTAGIEGQRDQLNEKVPEVQEKFNQFGRNINSFYQIATNNQTLEQNQLGGEFIEKIGDKRLEGTIPFMLNNRYATVQDILSDRTFFFQMLDCESSQFKEVMKSRTLDNLKGFFLPVVKSIDEHSWSILSATKNTEEFFKGLESIPNSKDVVASATRKSLKVMAYLEHTRDQLAYAIVKKNLEAEDKTFVTLSEEEKKKKIQDKLDDDTYVEKNITPIVEKEFLKQKLMNEDGTTGALFALEKYGVEVGEVEESLKEKLADVDEMKEDILGGEEISTLNLSESGGKEKLISVIDRFTEEVDDSRDRLFFTNYLPILDLLKTEDQTKQKILDQLGYSEFSKSFTDGMSDLKIKINEGKATKDDLANVEKKVGEFIAFQKELVVTGSMITKTRNENGNMIIDMIGLTRKGAENVYTGISLMGTEASVGNNIQGFAIAAGGLMTLDVITYMPRAFLTPRLSYSPTISMGKFVLKNSFSYGALQSRTILPSFIGQSFYSNPKLLFRDVAKGNLSIDKAMKISEYRTGKNVDWKMLGGMRLDTPNKFLRGMLSDNNPHLTDEHYQTLEKLIQKSSGNKNLLRDIIHYNQGKLNRFAKDKNAITYSVDGKYLDSFKDIFVKLDSMQPTEKLIFQNFLKHVDGISKLDDYFIMGIDKKYLKYFETGSDFIMSPSEFAKLMAKNKKLVDATEIEKLLEFISHAKGISGTIKTGNEVTFMQNVFKNWKVLSNLDSAGKLKSVESLKLNMSASSRAFERMNNALSTSKNFFGNLLKNKNLPSHIRNGISSRYTVIEEFMKLKIDEGVMKLSKNLGYSKFIDPAQLSKLQGLKQILKSPNAKFLGKVLAKAGFVLDAAFTGYEFYSDVSEVQDTAKINIERSEVQMDNAYFDLITNGVTLGATGAGTLVALGAASGPVGRVALGVGAGAMAVKATGDVYYDAVNEHYRNFEEFKSMTIEQIKQKIISLNAIDADIDVSWGDWLKKKIDYVTSSEEKEKTQTIKTVKDAIKAIIFLEETQNFPLSGMSMDDYVGDQHKEFRDKISKAKEEREKNVALRMDYFEKNVKSKTQIVSKEVLAKSEGLSALNTFFENSVIYAQGMKEGKSEEESLKFKDTLKENLVMKNKTLFEKFETIVQKNPYEIGYVIAGLEFYESSLDSSDSAEKQKIKENISFFREFVRYAFIGKKLPSVSFVNENGEIQTDKINCQKIESILLPPGSPLFEGGANTSSDDIEKLTGFSDKLGQNVLLRISNEVYGNNAKSEKELQVIFSGDTEQKEHTGIYFENGKRCIAGNSHWMKDAAIVGGSSVVPVFGTILGIGAAVKRRWNQTDSREVSLEELNTVEGMRKFREAINESAVQDQGLLDGQNADENLSEEYGKKMLAIIDEELKLKDQDYVIGLIQKYVEGKEGEFILPLDLQIKAKKAGLEKYINAVFINKGGSVTTKPEIGFTIKRLQGQK